jgi:hypothetical protein
VEDYALLTAPCQHISGTNKDHSEIMTSFQIPDKFKDPKSVNPDGLRRMNILLAMECSNGDVWLFIDHNRLIRFDIISQNEPWTSSDLAVDSKVCFIIVIQVEIRNLHLILC